MIFTSGESAKEKCFQSRVKREKVAALCILRFSELKTFGPCLIFVRAGNLSRKYWNYGIILFAIK